MATMKFPASTLQPGDRVHCFDEDRGSHLRTVAATTLLTGSSAGRVLVDWEGGDLLTPHVYLADSTVEVYLPDNPQP